MPTSQGQRQRAGVAVSKAFTALIGQKGMTAKSLAKLSEVPLTTMELLLSGHYEQDLGMDLLVRLSAALKFELWLYMIPREACQESGELLDDLIEGAAILELPARATNQDLVLKIGRYLCDLVLLVARGNRREGPVLGMADAFAISLKRRVGKPITLTDIVVLADVVDYVLQLRFMTQEVAQETAEYRAFRLREEQPVHTNTGPGALPAERRYVSLLVTVEPKAK